MKTFVRILNRLCIRLFDKFYASILFGLSGLNMKIQIRGATRILTAIFSLLPLRRINVNHPLGFTWYLDSREALWTYLISCEKFTTRIIVDIAKRIELGVCIGANRGWYPLVIDKVNPRIDLHAFEPNTLTYKLLENNVKKNNASIQIHKKAVGSQSEYKDIYEYKDANDGMVTLYPTGLYSKSFKKIEKVQVETVDSIFWDKNKIGSPTLLQIDCEGGEFSVLQGAKNFLKNSSLTIICEINPAMLAAAGSSVEELFGYISSIGYKIYWIDERGFLRLQSPIEPCKHLNWLGFASGSNYLFIRELKHLNLNYALGV